MAGAAPLLGAGSPSQPNFAHDIAPIVYRYCTPCHRPGQSGPFPLLAYSDVKKRAGLIAAVTRRRYMPPWLPQRGYGTFQDELALTPAQIRTIETWVEQGAPEGPAAEIPPPPHFEEGWQLGKPDLVLEAAPFELPASGPDIYWNFVWIPPIRATRYVRAIEIRPGKPRLVHHANLLVDRMGTAHLRETAPGKGFAGMELAILRSPFDPEGHFLFWKPGSIPQEEPAGFSWRLDPGNELVLNAHLQPSGKPETVRPAVALYFTNQPPARFPLLVQLQADAALNIPPGVKDFLVSDEFTLPMDADVLAIYPHAHYLGKLLEGYATLPSGKRIWLIRIPDWNPNWQAVYRYQQPIYLPKGSVISMRYHYDNSAGNLRNPNHPPRRVRAGNQAADEMAHLWLQVLPRGAGDRRRELQEALFRRRVKRNPRDFEAQFNLGAVLLSRLKTAEGVSVLQKAVRLDPHRAEAYSMLGAGLAGLGLTTEAVRQYQTAIQLQPELTAARLNLARLLERQAQFSEAMENYRAVLRRDPADVRAQSGMAQALQGKGDQLAKAGDHRQAAACFRQALSLVPESAALHSRLGEQLLLQSQFAEALQQFEQALTIDPTDFETREKAELVRSLLRP